MQVSYSTGYDLPTPIGPLIDNDLSGMGFYQIGLQKKPTGVPSNSTKDGYQESGIEEGMIYGGVFIMDNTDRGCLRRGQLYEPCCYNVGELDGKPVEGLY